MKNDNLLNSDLEEKLLKELHCRYIKRFGRLTYGLDQMEFFTTEIHKLIQLDLEDGTSWSPMTQLAQSLEQAGCIRFSAMRTSFFLTQEGYKRAEIGFFGKIQSWLNRNPGVIALAAFVVSIAGLFVGGDCGD